MQDIFIIPWINILVLSFPNGFFSFLAATLIMRESYRDCWKKSAIFGAIYAPYSYYMYYFAMKYGFMDIRVFTNVCFILISARLLVSKNWSHAFVIATLTFVFNIFSNALAAFVAYICGVGHVENFLFAPLQWIMVVWWPIYASMPVAAYFMRPTPIADRLQRLNEFMLMPGFGFIGVLLVMQMILAATAAIDFANGLVPGEDPTLVSVVMASFALFLVSTMTLLGKSSALAEKVVVRNAEENLNNQLNQLITAIRGQRHDFMSHVRFLTALALQGEYTQVRDYLLALNQELSVVNESLKIGNPFISSMINAKLVQAEQRGIHFQLESYASVEGKFVEKSVIEMVRILGNLIDNSQEAVSKMDKENRWIRMEIKRTGPILVFVISNPLPSDSRISEEIFRPGASSKGEGHQGLGLFIAKSLSDKIGGSLSYRIEPGPLISFVLALPQ